MSPPRDTILPAGARLAAKAAADRRARRRRIGRRLLRAAAALGPALLLGWLLLASPLLAVRSVAVTGTVRLTTLQVQTAAAVVPGTPLARVDTAAVVRRVAALAPVAQVEVSRGWPSTLRVRVVERVAVAGIATGGRITLVDATGVPFAPVPVLPAGIVRLQVSRPGPTDPTTRAALAVLAELPQPLRGRLLILRAASPVSVTLLLRDGRQVLWGGSGDAQRKGQAAEALLTMPGRVYDVSRPGVVTRR